MKYFKDRLDGVWAFTDDYFENTLYEFGLGRDNKPHTEVSTEEDFHYFFGEYDFIEITEEEFFLEML